jgi:hypothetical protein
MNPSKFSLNRRARDYWDSDRSFWNGQWESHKKTAARIVASRVLPGRQPAAGGGANFSRSTQATGDPLANR